MNEEFPVRWRKGDPTEDGYYLVKVEMPIYHLSFPSLRKFRDGEWLLTSNTETVTHFLDGLHLT